MLTTLLMNPHQDNGYHSINERVGIPSANFKVLKFLSHSNWNKQELIPQKSPQTLEYVQEKWRREK